MAQQFQVLRCAFCHLFQVQQVKKSKKWNCKVCNEKQSILKVFGQGSGSDCRHHVQKLNLLQGEIQQAPVNMLRDIEKPIEMSNENTINFKEKLGQQEEKVEIFSRWTKYLDKKCEEKEEEILQAEEQAYSSKGDIVKHTRKRKKTDLYTADTQRHEQRNVSGFTDGIKRFEENSYDSITMSTKCCGDAMCKNMLTPDVEGHMVDRKNKDPCSKGIGLSKWDKFLLPGKRQETAETSVVGENGRADPSVSISPCNYHHASQQNAAIPYVGAEEISPTHHSTLASIPVGRSKQPPSLPSAEFQQRLLNRLPEKTTSAHSTSIVVSSSTAQFRSLFSTGDFDDDI